MKTHVSITISFITASVLIIGCTWNDKLFNKYVRDDDSVQSCPPKDIEPDQKTAILYFIEHIENNIKYKCYNKAVKDKKGCYRIDDGKESETPDVNFTIPQEVQEYFDLGLCPNSKTCTPFASNRGSTDYYCANIIEVIECPAGQHQSKDTGACVPDDERNCGGIDCLDNEKFISGECHNIGSDKAPDYRCKADKCSNFYHVFNGKDSDGNYISCELNTTDHCGKHDIKCNITNAESVYCRTVEPTDSSEEYKAECIPILCNPGSHFTKDGKQCVPDDDTQCGAWHINCTNLAGWVDGKCQDSQCVASKCQSGSHLNADEGKCVLDTNEECGNPTKNCIGTGNEYCVEGICKPICPSEQQECAMGTNNKGCFSYHHTEHCGDCVTNCRDQARDLHAEEVKCIVNKTPSSSEDYQCIAVT